MKKFSVVVVNFYGAEVTKNLCDSLLRQSGLNLIFQLQYIVVDNSCSSVEYKELQKIKSDDIDILVKDAGENLGYFQGLNFGLNLATGDSVVIGNNDLVFQDNFFEILASRKEDGSVLALAPNIVTIQGRRQNPHMRDRITWFHLMRLDIYFCSYWIGSALVYLARMIGRKERLLSSEHREVDIHMGIGACYVLTQEFLKKFRFLKYPGFLYGEETYFSKQIHDAGGKILYVPALEITHMESVSTSTMPKRAMYDYARDIHWKSRLFL